VSTPAELVILTGCLSCHVLPGTVYQSATFWIRIGGDATVEVVREKYPLEKSEAEFSVQKSAYDGMASARAARNTAAEANTHLDN